MTGMGSIIDRQLPGTPFGALNTCNWVASGRFYTADAKVDIVAKAI